MVRNRNREPNVLILLEELSDGLVHRFVERGLRRVV